MRKTVINFNGVDCQLVVGKYKDGSNSLELINPFTNEFHATASINIEGVAPVDNEVLIKDYGDNKGMYMLLRNERVISGSKREVTVGFGKAYLVDLKYCQLCEDDETYQHLCKACGEKIMKQRSEAYKN